jgi:tetratricopeptide (TPR) repeat protein
LPRRALLHLRLAEALQALDADDFESLAYHFARAGQAEPARIYSLRAAERARQLLALKDATEHYHTALALWPEADPAGRAETLYRMGHCQWVSAETNRALETFQAARALFEQLGEWVKASDSERVIGRLCWEMGEREAARLHHQRALALLEGVPESVELGRAFSAISQMHLVAGEYDQAVTWGERALALAHRLGAEDVMVHALNNIGSARMHVYQFDPPDGLDLLRDSLRRALTLGLAHDACRAYFNLGEDLTGLCRYAEARAVFEELYAYAERIQAQIFPSAAVRRLAALDWSGGRWAEVLDRWQALLKSSTGVWGVWAARLVGRIYNDLGRTEAARLELERTLPRVLNWGEVQIIVPHLEQLARAYAALGSEADADQTVQRFLDLIDRSPYLDWSCIMPVIFACSWYTTRPETLAAARACLPRLERAHNQFRTMESEAALAEGQGIIALAEGAPLAATHHFRQAAAAWEALGRPYDQARVLKGLGNALHTWHTQHPQVGPVDSYSASARLACSQALAILDSLAAQVSDPVLRTSFLGSQLYREVAGLI